jgi:hypothetical protein
VLLEDHLYNPALARLNDLLFGVILLGTPHSRHGESADEMDALLNSLQPLQKRRLEKIREEFAAACALSPKFDGLTTSRPVWVLSESRPTRYSLQGVFKAKSKVVSLWISARIKYIAKTSRLWMQHLPQPHWEQIENSRLKSMLTIRLFANCGPTCPCLTIYAIHYGHCYSVSISPPH